MSLVIESHFELLLSDYFSFRSTLGSMQVCGDCVGGTGGIGEGGWGGCLYALTALLLFNCGQEYLRAMIFDSKLWVYFHYNCGVETTTTTVTFPESISNIALTTAAAKSS